MQPDSPNDRFLHRPYKTVILPSSRFLFQTVKYVLDSVPVKFSGQSVLWAKYSDRKSSFPLHKSMLGFAVWRRGIVGTRLFAITSCCEHDYFMFGLTGLMVSENVQQQDPIGFTWCTGNWDRRLLTCNPIQEDNWAQPQSNTVPKLHVIHSAKLSHQQ